MPTQTILMTIIHNTAGDFYLRTLDVKWKQNSVWCVL